MEESARSRNRQVNRKSEESLSHNDADGIKQELRNFHHGQEELQSDQKDCERETQSPSEITDDTTKNNHAHSFSSSENEDQAEQNRRIENDIQSRIEALKDDIKKELDRGEITRRNENKQVNRKSEESLLHSNNADDMKEELQNYGHEHEASAFHGKGGDMAHPAVLMKAKTAIINIQKGKNEGSVSISN
jgi:hypothetical protein